MSRTVELQREVRRADNPGPHLLITGGVHGDEYEPMAAIRQLIRFFDGPGRLVCGQVSFVPVVNEAAFRRAARTAEDECDLARVCPGQPDGSATERTAAALSGLIRAADYYIDLHSGGTQFVVLPMAGYMLHHDPAVLDLQREMARAFNLPIIWGTSCQLEGRSLSVARDARVPAIYAEYRGGAACDLAGVECYVTGCLNIMALLGMLARPQPESKVEHVVEDARRGSGHMQVSHRSPRSGFFQPAVELGSRVEGGQLIGTVSDVLGTELTEIRAERTGLILVLRRLPSIRKNESVGVVLELEDVSEPHKAIAAERLGRTKEI